MAKGIKKVEPKETDTKPKKKLKKITVKFFLNKAIQPVIRDKHKKAYPLYMLITYNRKNNMLKSYYGDYYVNMLEAEHDGLLELEQKIITKIILYERKLSGEKFEMKGLHLKYNKYAVSIQILFESDLRERLFQLAHSTKPYQYAKVINFFNGEVSFNFLYEVVKKIYTDFTLPKDFEATMETYNEFQKLYDLSDTEPQFNFPSVIEWLDLSLQQSYRNKLEIVYKNNPKRIESRMALVDKMVQKSIARP